jgi:hypothetical protein
MNSGPLLDLPRGLRGGSDTWDNGNAGALLSADVFDQQPGTLAADAAAFALTGAAATLTYEAAEAGITLGVHASAGSAGGNTATTAGVTTQAVSSFVVGVVAGGGTPTVEDNKGNTADYELVGTALASSAGAYAVVTRFYLCLNGIGGAGHTVTATAAGQFPSVFFQEIMSDNPLVLDGFTQQVDTVTPFTSGAITPSTNGAALVGFMGHNPASNPVVSAANGFTLQEQVSDTGAYYPGALEALIQTTAASIEASFTSTVNPGNGLVHVLALVEEPGGAEYTLTAAGGAYVLTGAEATLSYGVPDVLDAATGSYTLMGAAATLVRGWRVTAEAGGFVLAGGVGAPLLGSHTLKWDFEGAGTDPTTSSPITTVSGSTLVVPVLVANALDVAPTDSYGNTYTRYGNRINYTQWSGYGLSLWRATNIVGGAGHTVTVQKDIAPAAEITMNVIEVRDATLMTGSVSEELIGDPLVTAPVTTTGPSLLVAVWSGDSSAGPMTAVAQDGFTPLDSVLDNTSNWIQFASAYKVESDPLTDYDVEWVETPDQGALLGLFTFEGGSATTGLLFDRVLSAAPGTFAVTGADATLTHSALGHYTLTADSATYVLTGSAAELLVAIRLTADSGAVTLIGSDATLAYTPVENYVLPADAGAFEITGMDAVIEAARMLFSEAVAFALTGGDAEFRIDLRLPADPGAVTLTGADVALLHATPGNYLISAEGGAYTLTGADVAFAGMRTLTADEGNFALTGAAVEAQMAYVLAADSGPFALTGAAVTFGYGGNLNLTADAGSYALAGSAAILMWSGDVAFTVNMPGRISTFVMPSRVSTVTIGRAT